MTNTAFPLATVGGGFKSGPYLLKPFTSEVRRECPHARFIRLDVEPSRGAYLLAVKLSQQGSRRLSHGDRWLRAVLN
jgi:hypothetical protein